MAKLKQTVDSLMNEAWELNKNNVSNTIMHF